MSLRLTVSLAFLALAGCASNKFPHLDESAANSRKVWINQTGPAAPAGATAVLQGKVIDAFADKQGASPGLLMVQPSHKGVGAQVSADAGPAPHTPKDQNAPVDEVDGEKSSPSKAGQ